MIRARIASGELAPGQRLPGERAWMQITGLSWATVRRALAVLRAEGLIDVHQGQPSRVRETGEMVDVDLPGGTRITARMPTPAERERWGMPEGCPLLVALDVLDESGQPRVWPAHRYRLKPG